MPNKGKIGCHVPCGVRASPLSLAAAVLQAVPTLHSLAFSRSGSRVADWSAAFSECRFAQTSISKNQRSLDVLDVHPGINFSARS
eukprot:890336-Prymnesium_polylepis.1